jgi:hypothetical protein
MDGPADSARIYLLSADERQVSPAGPTVIDADGVRQELPPLVLKGCNSWSRRCAPAWH